MKSTKINVNIQKSLNELVQAYPLVTEIVHVIADNGGRSLLVGGAVRDLLLGLSTKDLDIEIYGLSIEQLEQLLRQFGPVSLVGKSFGVLRLHHLDVDWSLPRTDSAGRKPEVTLQPKMTIEDAFRRRDLTINAMGIDLITYELIDQFNGLHDLKNKILRAPDGKLFIEDPLRFYRVMQFMSRFEMVPDEQLNMICYDMDLSDVSIERIEKEFEKLLLKSKKPSLGIRWLKDLGRLKELFPELGATIGVQQNSDWHPEGDVFEHTMQTIDAAARFKYDDLEKKLVLLYAALCHDLGKATTTEKTEGVWRSIGHERESAKLVPPFLHRITKKKDLIDDVKKLVKYHMVPAQLVESDASLSSYKRLANKLAQRVTLQMLADLCLADKQGRNPQSNEPFLDNFEEVEQFLAQVDEAQVREQIEPPVLLGRDLLDVVKSGPEMGKLLKRAYEIQLEEGITDKAVLKERVLRENK